MNNEIITLYMTMLVYIYLIKMMSTTEMTKDKNHQKNQKHHMYKSGWIEKIEMDILSGVKTILTLNSKEGSLKKMIKENQ